MAGARNVGEWWLGGLAPVSQDTAERRAFTCTTCPKNEAREKWTSPVGHIAKVLKSAFAWKHQRRLSTARDEQLGICAACGCETRLKVWEPLDLILKQTDRETFDRLEKLCWQRKEKDLL